MQVSSGLCAGVVDAFTRLMDEGLAAAYSISHGETYLEVNRVKLGEESKCRVVFISGHSR